MKSFVFLLLVFLLMAPSGFFWIQIDLLQHDAGAAAAAAASFVTVVAKKKNSMNHLVRQHGSIHPTSWVLLDAGAAGAAAEAADSPNSNGSSSKRRKPVKRMSSSSSSTTAARQQQQQQRRQRSSSFQRPTRKSPVLLRNPYSSNNNNYYYYKKQKRSGSNIMIQFMEEIFPFSKSNDTHTTNVELTIWMQLQVQNMLSSSSSSSSGGDTTNTTANTATATSNTTTTTTTWQQLVFPSSSSQQRQQQQRQAAWTSYDEMALIRYLQQRQAYKCILLLIRHLIVHPNVFTYTAAISALATAASSSSSSLNHNHDNIERQECWNLFQEMQQRRRQQQHSMQLQPSSYTYSALFQACHGPAEAMALYKRLMKKQNEETMSNHNNTITNGNHSSSSSFINNNSKLWTKPVWESAIYACARRTPQDGVLLFPSQDDDDDNNKKEDNGTNNYNNNFNSSIAKPMSTPTTAWDTAQFFVRGMQEYGWKLSTRTYLALLFVCTETRDWEHAKELYHQLLEQQQQQQLSSNTTRTTTTTTTTTASSSSQRHIPMTPRLYGAVLQVCAVTGNHTDALHILQNMQTNKRGTIPNVQHCTSYLKALVTSDEVETAVEFLLHMAGGAHHHVQSSSFGNLRVAAPDLIAIQTVLQSCNYEQARKLLLLAQEGELGGFKNMPDERFYNAVLSKCEQPAHAKDIIRQMQLSRRYRIGAVPPSKLSYTKAITVCRKAQDVDTARFFLTSAKESGIKPDVYMYTAAIWAAAGSNDLTAALEFLAEMQANDCLPNMVSYNGVIAAFAAKGDCIGAIEMYETALERGLEGDATTFYQLVTAARKVKETKERIVLLERVWKPIPPQKYTIAICGPLLEALIGSYGTVGRIDDALDLFDRIQGPCNIACLRAITFACSVASPPTWQDAISILHTSDIVGGQAPTFVDQVALGYAMLACSKANEWEESLRLLHRYGGSGVPIAAVNSLIASCGRNGRPDMSLEILNEMESSYGLSPDVRSYRNAVIACNQAEHAPKCQENRNRDSDDGHSLQLLFQWWECALSLLRRMKEDGLTPDIQTYSSVISACEAAGQWQRALGVLQSIMDDATDDAELNVYCFNAAIAACEKGGAWVEALELYERMKATKNRLLQPTVVTYGSLILALDKAGQKELAISIWREAIRKGLFRPWRITRDGQGGKIRALDLHQFSAAMARACLRSHLECLLDDANASSPNNIQQKQQQQQPLTIVVGKGLHSQGGPVLLPTVQTLLWDEYGIRAIADEENTGRLFLSASVLEEMIAQKRWR